MSSGSASKELLRRQIINQPVQRAAAITVFLGDIHLAIGSQIGKKKKDTELKMQLPNCLFVTAVAESKIAESVAKKGCARMCASFRGVQSVAAHVGKRG